MKCYTTPDHSSYTDTIYTTLRSATLDKSDAAVNSILFDKLAILSFVFVIRRHGGVQPAPVVKRCTDCRGERSSIHIITGHAHVLDDR